MVCINHNYKYVSLVEIVDKSTGVLTKKAMLRCTKCPKVKYE